MHVFIIAAESADGFIARKPKTPGAFSDAGQVSTAWTSQEDKKRFVALTKRAGVVIMGSNTYKTFNRPLKDRRNIIYSHSTEPFPGTEKTQKEPALLIKQLENEGMKEVAICGGSMIYTLFMKSGLVDTIYLTIEPIFFGEGIKLFDKELDQSTEQKLTLVSSEKTEHNTLLLEYKVNKK